MAVLRDDTLLYEAQCNNGLTHSETLLPMIDTALKASGLTMDELDVLGVTNGPGSFTGLRIGLAGRQGAGTAASAALRRVFPPWPRWPGAWRAQGRSSARRTPAAGRSIGARLTLQATAA